jgi:hypothetical protein
MGTVILDDALKARLNGLNEQLEVRDTDGTLVGRFLPEDQYMRLMYDWARAEFAREEAEDAAKGIVRTWDGTNGKTTSEAIAYLQSLWQQKAAGR